MALFSAQKNIYFLFDGKGNRQFSDSMLHLDADTYLWTELRESLYRQIYFVRAIGSEYTLQVMDDHSREKYMASCKKILGKRPSMPEGSYAVSMDGDQLRRWMQDVLVKSSAETTAVLFSVEDFCKLYAEPGAGKWLSELIEREKSGSTLLLTAPMRIRTEQLACFLSPESPLRQPSAKKKKYLCPDISKLAQEKTVVPLFEQLRYHLADQFVELGSVTYEKMKSLMRCVRFQREESWTEDELLRYTNILYNWWYLPVLVEQKDLRQNFVRYWRGLFFEERQRDDLFCALFHALCGPGWKSFQDHVDTLQKEKEETALDFLHTLERSAVENRCHITLYSPQLADMKELPWPGELYAQTAQRHAGMSVADRKKWSTMQAGLLVPRNREIPENRLKHLEGYCLAYRNAETKQDYDTLCRAVNAMLFGGTYLYETSDTFDFDERFINFTECLRASEAYFVIKSARQEAVRQDGIAQGVYVAMQAQEAAYERYLSGMDTYLGIPPELSVQLDAQRAEELFAALKQETEVVAEAKPEAENAEEVEKEEPLFAEDVHMSAEEADAWLRAHTNRQTPF